MQLLDRNQVARIDFGELDQILTLFRQVFAAKKAGRAINAQEVAMIPQNINVGAFYSLPGYLLDQQIAGIKWTSHVPKSHGDFSQPVILLNDLSTGDVIAQIDGLRISGLRTAYVALLAIKQLVPHTPQSILICGTGFQAQNQLQVLQQAFDQTNFLIWDRHLDHAKQLARRAGDQVTAVESLPQSVAVADVVIGATSADTPYLQYRWLHAGQLYVHIGLHDIGSADVARFHRVVCDDFEAGRKTSQQSLFMAARLHQLAPDAIELLENHPRPLKPDDQPVMFDEFGLQIFDLALADQVVRQSQKEARNDNRVIDA